VRSVLITWRRFGLDKKQQKEFIDKLKIGLELGVFEERFDNEDS
jgi:hypothetical protein